MADDPVSFKKAGNVPVLIVEDDLSTFIAMRTLLEHYGFEVSHAPTVAKAIAWLSVGLRNPHYIFLDLMLPDGDGLRVLEHVRTKNLPVKVVVITGTSDPDRMRRVEHLTPEAILHKPLDFFSLLEKIKPA